VVGHGTAGLVRLGSIRSDEDWWGRFGRAGSGAEESGLVSQGRLGKVGSEAERCDMSRQAR